MDIQHSSPAPFCRSMVCTSQKQLTYPCRVFSNLLFEINAGIQINCSSRNTRAHEHKHEIEIDSSYTYSPIFAVQLTEKFASLTKCLHTASWAMTCTSNDNDFSIEPQPLKQAESVGDTDERIFTYLAVINVCVELIENLQSIRFPCWSGFSRPNLNY